MSEINNAQLDNAKDIGVLMWMYNMVIFIRKHLEVYGNTVEINQL